MGYIVERLHGRHQRDYLIGFDPIWGGTWSLSGAKAMRFESEAKAETAMDDVVAIGRPVSWRMPDFGFRPTFTVCPVA
jgi:hypothetical protein